MDDPVVLEPPVEPAEITLERYRDALAWCSHYYVRLETEKGGRWCAEVYSHALEVDIEYVGESFLDAIDGLRAKAEGPALGVG